jgi:hypothetical protein
MSTKRFSRALLEGFTPKGRYRESKKATHKKDRHRTKQWLKAVLFTEVPESGKSFHLDKYGAIAHRQMDEDRFIRDPIPVKKPTKIRKAFKRPILEDLVSKFEGQPINRAYSALCYRLKSEVGIHIRQTVLRSIRMGYFRFKIEDGIVTAKYPKTIKRQGTSLIKQAAKVKKIRQRFDAFAKGRLITKLGGRLYWVIQESVTIRPKSKITVTQSGLLMRVMPPAHIETVYRPGKPFSDREMKFWNRLSKHEQNIVFAYLCRDKEQLPENVKRRANFDNWLVGCV